MGVAARIAWAPILRGERGGKLWLEYWSEKEEWVPWMPSIGKVVQSKANLLEFLSDRVGMIFIHQDKPENVTESYLPVCEISFAMEDKRIRSRVLLLGSQGFIAMAGLQTGGYSGGKTVKVARGGEIYLAVSKDEVAYFLTKVNLGPEEQGLEIRLEAGKPTIQRRELTKN